MDRSGTWVVARQRATRRRVAAVATALGVTASLLFCPGPLSISAGAQGDPEPPPTTEPVPTTAPPTTAPPTTEAPTTLPPTTDAPAPTTPPTTSGGGGGEGGGGGGTVRPAAPTSVPTTEVPSTTTTALRSTVVAPVPGAVTVPEENPAPVDEAPSGPWLSPETQLRVAVGGLVALAVVMVLLTVAYWRHTRPGRSTPLVGLDDDAPPDPEPTDAVEPAEEPRKDGDDRSVDDVLPAQPVGVAGGSVAPPPTPSPGYSAAPPSALPPPTLGLRPVPTSESGPGTADP